MEISKVEQIVKGWAASHAQISKVWLFGSRVRGTHRPDSDLDVAVEIDSPYSEDELLGAWIRSSEELQSSLSTLLPMVVQLEWYGGPEETSIIHDGIMESSILVYETRGRDKPGA
ncbi:nucleotidyltransferase domain-containing protein [Pseudomonas sp. 10B1]|uniref:nucleotidyltransferase family protein n=1 Tax=Pseudomonas sp. 10B1 TaxID=3048573 RepID=UPI002B23DB88|nr:nucleotidyltransferase domain-containing protein [Pseudomonas sp. 10B1]MEB0308338.1 nucleotidyltransferase domain-containing protein [Pseudomonas sp. 10B1]